MIDQARKKARGSRVPMDFVVAPLEQLPFPPHSFDTVLSIDVFCSVGDTGKAFDEVLRVLKPGGTVILVEHFRTGDWRKDFKLLLLTVFVMKWLLGVSMVRDLETVFLSRRELTLKERGKLGNSFQYFVLEKK